MTARRGAVVRATVLRATLEELAERGYAGLTVDGVAHRAGVHKTTVYRRWPDREALVTDAVLERASAEFAMPDTGSIDADLASGLRALAAWLTGPVGSPLVAMLASDAARLPAVAAAKQRFFAARAAALAGRLRSAIAAGQLPPRTDPARMLKALVAPLYLHLLVLETPPTDADCDTAAAVALHAARSGLFEHPAE